MSRTKDKNHALTSVYNKRSKDQLSFGHTDRVHGLKISHASVGQRLPSPCRIITMAGARTPRMALFAIFMATVTRSACSKHVQESRLAALSAMLLAALLSLADSDHVGCCRTHWLHANRKILRPGCSSSAQAACGARMSPPSTRR